MKEILQLSLKLNSWNDMIFFKKSLNEDGVVKAWLNGQLVFEHFGANIFTDASGYTKFGLYSQIFDERTLYFDAIRLQDHIDVPIDEWAIDQEITTTISSQVKNFNSIQLENNQIILNQESTQSSNIQIFDFLGKIKLGKTFKGSLKLDLGFLEQGLYVVKVNGAIQGDKTILISD